MAIEVVGQSEAVKRRRTCDKCGSILEYLPVDVICTTRTDYTGDRDEYHHICCPKCGKELTVKWP